MGKKISDQLEATINDLEFSGGFRKVSAVRMVTLQVITCPNTEMHC